MGVVCGGGGSMMNEDEDDECVKDEWQKDNRTKGFGFSLKIQLICVSIP